MVGFLAPVGGKASHESGLKLGKAQKCVRVTMAIVVLRFMLC